MIDIVYALHQQSEPDLPTILIMVSDRETWETHRFQGLSEAAFDQVTTDLEAAGINAPEITECCYEVWPGPSLADITAQLTVLTHWQADPAFAAMME
jgi:hypothetical protein